MGISPALRTVMGTVSGVSVIEWVLAEGYDLTNTRVSGGTGCLTGAGTGRG